MRNALIRLRLRVPGSGGRPARSGNRARCNFSRARAGLGSPVLRHAAVERAGAAAICQGYRQRFATDGEPIVDFADTGRKRGPRDDLLLGRWVAARRAQSSFWICRSALPPAA